MVLEHIVAILLFSGPLLYIGVWMAIDPAGIVNLPSSVIRVLQALVRQPGSPSVENVESDQAGISPRLRRVVRIAGLALVVFSVVA